MTYVKINVKEVKEALDNAFNYHSDQEKKLLWNFFLNITEPMIIDSPEWDEVMQYADDVIEPKVHKLKAHNVVPQKTCNKKVNTKKMIGELPNFKKNMKRIL